MWRFIADNRRWLATGFLLTLASSFGQTWFISLFAGEIRAEFGLTDGQWGRLYTVATLASAAVMVGRGALADTIRLSRLAPAIALLFAVAALGMALSPTVWVLGLAIFGLRFCGQGMFFHIAMTAMGRWFVATRGRAVALASLGHSAGEGLVPLAFVPIIAWLGWRGGWGIAAVLLALVVAPLLWALLTQDRAPTGSAEEDVTAGMGGHHWTRADALRHWLFWALLPLMLTPGFIGTVVFFHPAHIAEVQGWRLADMVGAYPIYAVTTVVILQVAGRVVDAIGPERLLPVQLLPMAVGCAFLAGSELWTWFASLAFLGISQGIASAVWGTLLPKIYGTNHLGAVRSLVTAIMVLATAIGPGVTGAFIDWGVPFPDQGPYMAAWCVGLSALLIAVLIRLRKEGRAPIA